MQDDTSQVSRQRRKVYTYWIDDDGRYIGRCFRYGRFLPDTIYAVIWMNILVEGGQMYAIKVPLILITLLLYLWFLKWSAMYYSLDGRGTPTAFLSSQIPTSLLHVRPLTRKRFLMRAGQEAARG